MLIKLALTGILMALMAAVWIKTASDTFPDEYPLVAFLVVAVLVVGGLLIVGSLFGMIWA
jgi:hypothetical protein